MAMASKLLFLKDRYRKKAKDDDTDELGAVKAAAWAWYQRGSGSEGKAVCEFDATTTRTTHHRVRDPKPSRYKLEAAMKNMDKEAKEREREGLPPIHTNNKPLLDAYEIQSISKQLDNLLESDQHNKLGNGSLDNNGIRRMNKKKKMRRSWFWIRHGAICGTEEDVIDTTTTALRDGRRQLAKCVPAVNLVKLPTVTGAL